MIVLGCPQLACRLLDLNYPDLVGPLLARHGAGNSRAPHSDREPVKSKSRRLVRGSPTCEAPQDLWPGTKALKRPATVCNEAEPQAEQSAVLSDRVAVSNADLAPHASMSESAQPASPPPKSVE